MTTDRFLSMLMVLLALIQGGWLTFDGIRALKCGDYFTPKSGPRAGQLGPWAGVVTALGGNPRSKAMKLVHVGLGLAWLGSAVCVVLRLPGSIWLLPGCALGTLWYVPLGTLIGLVQLALALILARGA